MSEMYIDNDDLERLKNLNGMGKTILVIEDDRDILTLLCEYLRKYNFNVLSSDSITGARELFAGNAVDIAVIDIILPDGHGIDIATEFCRKNPEVIIIMNTGYSEEYYAYDEIKKKGFHFLQKPFSIVELLSILRTICN